VQDLLFGLLVLPAAVPGVPPYPPAAGLLVVAFLFNAGTGLMLWQGWVRRRGLRLGQHVPVLRDHVRTLAEVQESFVTVATSPTALWGALLDMGAIGLAGLGLWLCLLAVGATHTPWIASVAIYGLGTSARTLSALPGGVGANEDVSTLVLTHMGVAAGTAAAAMLLFRATTVLMRMAIGWLVLLVASPRLKIQMSPGGLVTAIQGVNKQTHAGNDARQA
jgi:uncharacterized membrane protein YbhN (UPF0104 family)